MTFFYETAHMKVKILAFGIAREIIGDSNVSITSPDHLTVGDLRSMLEKDYSGLLKLSSYMIAVNDEYALPDVRLQEGDEIAIIPPVSGG